MSGQVQGSWQWADHVCRNCLSRLVRRDAPGGPPVFECGNCTISAKATPDAICGCGVLPKPLSGKVDPKAPRFRCSPNPNRTAGNTAAVIVQWGVGP